MDVARLTVAQVTSLLTQNEVPEQLIQRLKTDSRVSVIRLLNKWQQRQNAVEREKDRIQKLFRYEKALLHKGYELIAGVDEAGRGPLAGPVVIAAVILPVECYLPNLNDSKKLSAKQRFNVYHAIKAVAIAYRYTIINVADIDQLNIYQATIRGMYQVIEALHPQPQAALIDAVPLPDLTLYSESLIRGDALSASIAAASIIAKVERDRIMDKLDQEYPMYGFAKHKGYGTAEHIKAIQQYGPCPIHRRTFEPIKSWGE